MSQEFKTEIVKTKEYKKSYSIIFGVLYLIANFYLFLLEKENQNIYLKFLSLIIILLGAYFLFGMSFIKPKVIGIFKLSEKHITIEINGVEKNIKLNELESIFLKYMDYGSWKTHSIYGNKNYLKITTKNGEKYNFEILLRNKEMKTEFKSALNNFELNEKFEFVKINNSRTEF
ncbi:hypothetical protein [Polaribacter sp.]|uniref:hypothetical protein n=1 Tax=Polaribacter sp. TaxID=1920175 RepID=UPI00404807CC